LPDRIAAPDLGQVAAIEPADLVAPVRRELLGLLGRRDPVAAAGDHEPPPGRHAPRPGRRRVDRERLVEAPQRRSGSPRVRGFFEQQNQRLTSSDDQCS